MDQNLINNLNKIEIQVGDYTIHPIPTGLFGLDGGAMFGTVPKVLWQKTNPADENNRIQMEARALLLISPTKKILIDTGNGSDFVEKYGDKLGNKFSEMYALDKNGPNLYSSLKKYNLKPEDITDVILTHLHFDHAGGATKYEDGKIVPTFKNATYHLQKKNLDNASQPNAREQASYFKANYEPLIQAGQLNLIDSTSTAKLNQVTFMISNGHTVGHQSVIISDDKTQVVYCGDVIPTSTHVRSAWVMGYDLNPLQLMDEKKQLLNISQKKQTYYFFEHDPYCDMATVEPDKNDFKVKERFWLK